MITVDIALEEKDYINFSSYVQLKSPQQKQKLQKAFMIRVLIGIFVLAIIAWSDSATGNYTTTITYACILVFLTVVNKFSRPKAMERSLRALYNQPDNDTLFENKEYTFSETGLGISSRYSSTQMKWAAIVKKIESNDYIYLYTSAVHALIIPLRFLNGWRKEEVDKLLIQHLSFQADVGHVIPE